MQCVRSARLAATQLSGSGEHAISVGVDVTAQSDMARMAAEAVGRFGRIDILAANAGIYPHIQLADLRVADLEEIMAVNVGGALLAIQACLPQMTTQGCKLRGLLISGLSTPGAYLQRFRSGSSPSRKMSAGPCAFLLQRKRGT